MKKINIGIIGLGVIGQRLIPTFLKHERTNIVGVYDIDSDIMRQVTEKFDLRPVNAYEELIDDESIDMIYIAVPPQFHHELAIKVLDAGKHVFCEKPLAGTIEEAEDMCKRANESGLLHGMNFPLYYNFGYDYIKTCLKDDVFGQIKRIELNAVFPVWPRPWQQNKWIDTRQEGGFTREIFTHFIQLIHDSFGDIQLLNYHVRHDDPSKSENELIAVGQIDDIKVLFNGLVGVNEKEDLRLIIRGEKASVELVNWRDVYLTKDQEKIQVEPVATDATYNLIDAFYKAIDGEENNLVSFDHGLKATKIVETLLL
ncbi:Gfo/Idh/MocA family oxidoreductase [Acidaminobacter sp. JC074]|uniref:Gfo/Idh/MocA family protein n=1 Tax=Acidaminobacter sp. JC074 TaxID=2530199 RepID=UPI001F0EAC49|nr:Gfo/Idh/MocA family oxidoreductase [Acidaminobacter sp. JC074]MCH4887645.1 Gfo/Idh/MocA family oxidoreductase [Acidaminobacter sp. JC074]